MEYFCDTMNATITLEDDINQYLLEPEADDFNMSLDVSINVCNDNWLPSDMDISCLNESSVLYLVCKFDSLTTNVDIVSSSSAATMPGSPIQLPACLQNLPDFPLSPMSPMSVPPTSPTCSPVTSPTASFSSPTTSVPCVSLASPSASPISAYYGNIEPAAKRRCVRRLF